jgi:predicted membrane-bound spermidine synthase
MFGNFYQSLAMLIAAFMTGLAIGAFLPGWFNIPFKNRVFAMNQVLIGISALMLSLIVFLTEKDFLDKSLIQVCLYFIMVFSGIVTAVHFTLAAGLQKATVSQTASKTYGADLLGSAGGAVLVAVAIIPLIGLMQTGWLLAGLNLVVAGWLFFRLKNTSV